MREYFEPSPSDSLLEKLRLQRVSARRTVSLGLVMLAGDCESLLRGTVCAQNEQQFIAAWEGAMRRFDLRAEMEGDAANALFEQVSVCGNCHAVCRKLENLIKTYFVQHSGRTEQMTADKRDDGDDMAYAAPAESGSHQLVHHSPPMKDTLQAHAQPTKPQNKLDIRQVMRSSMTKAVTEGEPDFLVAVDETQVAKGIAEIVSRAIERIDVVEASEIASAIDGAEDLYQSLVNKTNEKSALAIKELVSSAISKIGEAEEQLQEVPNDPDDDASIVPEYPAVVDPPEFGVKAQGVAVESASASELRKVRMSRAIESTADLHAAEVHARGKKFRFSSMYQHIGMIFPVAYSQVGPK